MLVTPAFGTADDEVDAAIREIDAARPVMAVIDRTPIDGRTFDECCPRLAAHVRERFEIVAQCGVFDVLIAR